MKIKISLEMAKEFIKWAKDKSFCNSGQHICDRLATEFEEQLSAIYSKPTTKSPYSGFASKR